MKRETEAYIIWKERYESYDEVTKMIEEATK